MRSFGSSLTKKRSVFFWVLTVLSLVWTAFIFSNSLKNADDSLIQSGCIVDFVIDSILCVPDDKLTVDFAAFVTNFVRKLAHFFEFFVLGTLLLLYRNLWKTNATLHLYRTLFFGMAAALFDETLQLTSPGRGSLVADVWLDFSAVVVSATVYSLISCLIKYKKSKKSV